MENRLNIKTAVKASGYSGFKADILRKFMLLVMSVSIMSVFLGFSVSSAAGKKSVIDDAGLIKASDEKKLDKKIKNIQKDKFDVVILTVKSLDGKSAQDYADDYYDNNDYGLDNEKSGVLFRRDARKGLEPMREMRGAMLEGPFLHAVGDGVCHVKIERLALLHGFRKLLVHVRGQILLHDVIGEDHGSITTREVGVHVGS